MGGSKNEERFGVCEEGVKKSDSEVVVFITYLMILQSKYLEFLESHKNSANV